MPIAGGRTLYALPRCLAAPRSPRGGEQPEPALPGQPVGNPELSWREAAGHRALGAARHAEGDQLRDNAAGAGHSDQGLGTLIETLKGLSGGGPTLVDICTRTASIHSAASPNS